MVRSIYAVLIGLVISSPIMAEGERKRLTPDSLRKIVDKGESDRKDAKDRLKVLGEDTQNIKLLRDRDIYYTLPTGKRVLGVILPNGSKSPAVKIKGKTRPACVLEKGHSLIPGTWNSQLETIECPVEQHKLALIPDQKQISNLNESPSQDKTVDQLISEANRPAITINKNSGGANPSKAAVTSSSSSVTAAKGSTPTPKSNPNLYVPPSNRSSTSKSVGAVLSSNTKKFGIPIGTWAKCSLDRRVSSAERGFIEITLQEELNGKYRSLPSGTTLFAKQQINVSTERLEATITKALTPTDEEYDSINAFLYSPDRSAGLPGTLNRDRDGEAKSAAGKAAISGVSSALPNVTGVAGQVVGTFTNEMIDNEDEYVPDTPSATIEVSPQQCLIKVARSF